MGSRDFEMMDAPSPPGRTYPGIRVKLLKEVLREVDASASLQKIFGRPVSDKLALVHKGNQFTLVNAHEIDLTPAQEKEFTEAIGKIMTKHNKKWA